jgi:hypothetical protein
MWKKWQIRKLEQKLAGLEARNKTHIALASQLVDTDPLMLEDRLATCQMIGEIREKIRQLGGKYYRDPSNFSG